MSPPPPPQFGLNADVIREILLRVPPDEPEHLFRAALVCKPWLRVLCDPAFLRRYHAFDGAPPLLGLLHRHQHQIIQGDRLAPTTAAPPPPYPTRDSITLDCRHGRALIDAVDGDGWHFVVWDPVTGDQRRLPEPGIPCSCYTAAVLCAADGCDHLDCHGGPFRVFFAGNHDDTVITTVYSSGNGYQPMRCVLVGDDIYFTLLFVDAIGCGNNCLSMIDPPSHNALHIALIVMEDTSLGFACIEGSYLYLWSRKVNSEGDAEWVQCRKALKVEGLVPVAGPDDKLFVAGFAEGVGVIFINSGAGLFAVELKSDSVRKVAEPGVYFSVLPYMSFYTPDCGRLSSLARLTDN